MRRFAIRGLQQEITYWPPTDGQTNDFGHEIYGTPTLLKGRWEDKAQQIRKATGEEVTSSAEVFVDRSVDVSGFLAKGDFTEEDAPILDAREIQAVMETPDLRNLDTERRAFL